MSTTGPKNALQYKAVLQHFVEAEDEHMLYVNIVSKKYLEVERIESRITRRSSSNHLKSDHRDPYKKFCDDKKSADFEPFLKLVIDLGEYWIN